MEIKTVGVAGAGTMGNGIAHVFAKGGYLVVLLDVEQRFLDHGLETIRKNLEREVAKAKLTSEQRDQALARITGVTNRKDLGACDFIVEAAGERFDVKAELFRDLDALCRSDVILSSNTSSISITKLAALTKRPDKVIGMHFFNPVPVMKLVEVIRGLATSDETFATVNGLAQKLEKTPVEVNDAPGFVSNRVLMPLLNEAMYAVMEGVATPEAVDEVFKLGMAHPMGPLTLLDFTGLHTHLGSSETALREFGDPRYRPIPLVRTLVRAGMTGRAAGRGFYDYAQEKPRAAVTRLLRSPGQPGSGVQVTPAGPGANRLAAMLPAAALAESGGLPVYRAGAPQDGDVRAVRELAAAGPVVVDSSDGHWIDQLPAGAGWVHLHRTPADELFAEVVRDEVAGIGVPDFVGDLLDSVAAPSAEVLALPGLVADRLAHCMVNEASALVEERLAVAADIDLALRLGMNHPRGPFGQLEADGVAAVYASLVSMSELTGDPRYRPAQLLRRQAARR